MFFFAKKNYLSLQFFVKNVYSKTSGTSTFHFGKQISDLLLALNLFNQVGAFNKVTKLSITVRISNLMEFQKRLVNSLFQFQLALNRCSAESHSWAMGFEYLGKQHG